MRKAHDHHAVNIVPVSRVVQIHETPAGQYDAVGDEIHRWGLHREVEQMINDENENDQPAHEHRARSVTGHDHFVMLIAHRTRAPVFYGQLARRPNMQPDQHEQADAREPKKFWDSLEEGAIGIELLCPQKNLQIPDHMEEHKNEK